MHSGDLTKPHQLKEKVGLSTFRVNGVVAAEARGQRSWQRLRKMVALSEGLVDVSSLPLDVVICD